MSEKPERVYCNNPMCEHCARYFGWWTPDFYEATPPEQREQNPT